MPHYNRAPITEALIDIRVEAPQLRFEDLQALRPHLAEYPKEESRNIGAVTIQLGPGVASATEQKPWSLVFRNKTDNQVAQFAVNGFTFSRLEPYQDWEHLRNEARRLWDIYRQFAKPQRIVRIAVRYINVLKFPGERVEPEQFLKIYPEVPKGLPPELQDYGPFSMRLPFYQYDLRAILVINEGNAIVQQPGFVSIALDLDLFVENPQVNNEQQLWEFFEKLRERKNRYFEASITDKTRELIK